MKKTALLMFAVLVVSLCSILCLSSCNGGEQPDGTLPGTDALAEAPSESPSEAPTEAATEQPTEAATEAATEQPTEAPTEEITQPEVTAGAIISSPEISVFQIVYPADASDAVKDAALYLAQSLRSAFGTAPAVVADTTPPVPDGFEILVGKTNRQAAPLADCTDRYTWCVQVSDCIISLDAVDESRLVRAADHLVEAYAKDSTVLGLKMITDYTDNGEKYRQALHFSVPGERCYTVVYDEDATEDVVLLAQWFSRSYTARGNTLQLSAGLVDGPYVKLELDNSLATDWAVEFGGNGIITVRGKDKDALAWGLTQLTGSRMVADRYGEILISDTGSMSGDMSTCTREGWALPVPAYEGGTLSSKVYNCGAGIENDAKRLAYSQSYMMCVSGTTLEEYRAYLEKLVSCGYVPDSESTLASPGGENLYAQYINGVSTVYVYFLPKAKEVRVIDDRASVPESLFEYDYTPVADDVSDVILYGLYLHPLGINANEPGGDPSINNCGEFMMIRQPDNSLFLIDGGSKLQATDEAVEGAWAYMHEITGTPENEKLKISCWFITHPHGDHYAIVAKLLEKHGDMMEVERVMFNFPHADTINSSITQAPRTAINKYCPNALVMKCHSGQSISLGGIVVDVMTAHEDAVSARTGTSTVTETNSTCTVIRITLSDGQRVMILGDITAAREEFFAKNIKPKELSCRMVQVAHHAWNVLPRMYRGIGAEYALWPQYEYSNFENVNNHYVLATNVANLLDQGGAKYHYFSGLNTVRLTCRGGEIEVTLTDPIY